jgi:GNAT superfamily N-acetyltransferase
MQTKNLFSIIVSIFSLTTQFYSNAMLVPKKASPQSLQQHKAKFCSSKISSYNPEHHEKIVKDIASPHLRKLISGVTPDNKDDTLQQIINTMNGTSTISKVYVVDEKPIGFINYYVCKPWKITNNLNITNAHINFVAIDDEYHGKGAGTALLNDALDDLKSRSVNTVTLMTTDDTLNRYYYRHNFDLVGTSRYTGCSKLKKRLKPHPVKLIATAMYEKMFNNKE